MFKLLSVIMLSVLAPSAALALPQDRIPVDPAGFVHGGESAAAKAAVDTVVLIGPWGSGAAVNGQFQSPAGSPAWNGWTSRDNTLPTEHHWQVSADNAPSGALAAWCGDLFDSCGEGDPAIGYGNRWNEWLEWRGRVDDAGAPCTVSISALVALDTEPFYDPAFVTVVTAAGPVDLWMESGLVDAQPVAVQATYQPGDYVGASGDEVVVQFRFTSDISYSDQDCNHPSAGAVRLDDVAITLDNGAGYAHDFEDGTLGALVPHLGPGVGDFAKIWTNLDYPRTYCEGPAGNRSPMVAFIDDGLVVPGTGGTMCIDHCYGPGGYIVNNSGGLVGPDALLNNTVVSPPVAWPGAGYTGGTLSFDVFRDEALGSGSPGMFFYWEVRSTAEADPAALERAPWLSRNFVFYGARSWVRFSEPIGDLIARDARWVQVHIGAIEVPFSYFFGSNGTPAPWFDNVRLAAHERPGPVLAAYVPDLPHDAFPDQGLVDLDNLGTNHVRFDSGVNTAFDEWSVPDRNDPGDSVVIRVTSTDPDAEPAGAPRMHWRLQRNPTFDPYRSAGLPDEGSIEGWQTASSYGSSWAFDLPDTGFLFPGDFLYYYFEATDVVNDELRTSLLPADTTGYSNFDDPMAYPPIYKLHALPTVAQDLGQPAILFWDDGGAAGNREEWYSAWDNLGMTPGIDYDIYYTSGPGFAEGHGLGGRATLEHILGYTEMVYTSGVQAFTLSDATVQDPSRDVQLLTAWLESGGRDLMLAGDDLAGEMSRLGLEARAFLQDWMGVDLVQENVLDVLDGQTAPLVVADQDAGLLAGVDRWDAAGACESGSWLNGYYNIQLTTDVRYDGVVARPGAVRLAEFTTPDGQAGAYPYSAATLNVRADVGSRVVSLPYDLQSVRTNDGDKDLATMAARSRLLQSVLQYFGMIGPWFPSPVPSAEPLAAGVSPNPFNPVTTIAWSLPASGPVQVEVYDVRGRLVRGLYDGPAPAGPGEVCWDGREADGRAAAAGVYFYRVRGAGEEIVGKMALIK
jgi:hypothetical protein